MSITLQLFEEGGFIGSGAGKARQTIVHISSTAFPAANTTTGDLFPTLDDSRKTQKRRSLLVA